MTDSNVKSGFVAHLRSRGMSEEYINGFSYHVDAFFKSQPSVEPRHVTASDLENHLAEETRRGASERDLRNRSIALEALLEYVAATRVPPQPAVAEPAAPAAHDQPASADPRAPLRPAGNAKVAAASEHPTPLGELLRRPLSKEGALASAGLAIPILGGYVPLIGWWLALLYYPGTVGYYFLTMDHMGRGLPGMARFESIAAEDIRPLMVRGVACLLPMMLPFAAVALWGPAEDSSLYPMAMFGSVAVGALLGPAVILSVYLTSSAFSAFHPGAWWRIISEFGWRYAPTAAVFALLSATVVVTTYLTDPWLPGGPLGQALRAFVLNFVWLSQACVLGDFVRRNSHRLGGAV